MPSTPANFENQKLILNIENSWRAIRSHNTEKLSENFTIGWEIVAQQQQPYFCLSARPGEREEELHSSQQHIQKSIKVTKSHQSLTLKNQVNDIDIEFQTDD